MIHFLLSERDHHFPKEARAPHTSAKRKIQKAYKHRTIEPGHRTSKLPSLSETGQATLFLLPTIHLHPKKKKLSPTTTYSSPCLPKPIDSIRAQVLNRSMHNSCGNLAFVPTTIRLTISRRRTTP
jgi:hypothetical protein